MAIYDKNNWTHLTVEPWNDDYNFRKEIDYIKKAQEMDYIKMFPTPDTFDQTHINQIINSLIQDKTSTQTKKGTENHFGDFEDVKQPLTLDPSLDF